MSDKIPGIISGAVSPFAGLISASPGLLGTARSTQDLKDRARSGVDLAKETAIGNAKTEGKEIGINVLDNFQLGKINLGSVARSALGRTRDRTSKTSGDPLLADPFGFYSLARSRPDPMINLDFIVELPEISGNLKLPDHYVEDITINTPNYDDYSVMLYGRRDYFASFQDIQGFTLTLYEDSLGSTYHYFRAWLDQIRLPNGTFRPPSLYQKNIRATFITPMLNSRDGNYGLSFAVTFLRAYPVDLSGYEMVSGSSDRIRPSVQFKCSSSVSTRILPTSKANIIDQSGEVVEPSINNVEEAVNPPLSRMEQAKKVFSAVKSFAKVAAKEQISNIPNKIKF